MLNVHIAEWILGLVTSRDRAASTAGDLMEEAETRGLVWFWSGVLRTATSLLWRDVVENPARVAGTAFLGLAIFIGLDLLFAGLSGVALFFVPLDSWNSWLHAATAVNSLLAGRVLARMAPGRELAACLVYTIFVSVYNLSPVFGDNGASSALLCILSVLAGTGWGRYRRLGATE